MNSKFLFCLLSMMLLVSTAAAQATIPDSVLVPLNQLATDLDKKTLDTATKTTADAAVVDAQAAAETAAKAVADDVVAVNKSTEALQAAIAAWVNQVRAAKSLKVSLPPFPPAPDGYVTTSVKRTFQRASTSESSGQTKHRLRSRLFKRQYSRG